MASALLATARYLDYRLRWVHARCFGAKAPQHDALLRSSRARAPAPQQAAELARGPTPQNAAIVREALDGVKAPSNSRSGKWPPNKETEE